MVPQRFNRALLVVNPGSRRGRKLMEAAAGAVEAAGVRCDVLLTSAPGDAARAVESDSHSYDVVFTLGGDGTAMEVLGAMPGDGPPVAVLHGGTGNLIAQALRVPRPVRRAVRALLAGSIAQIDLGRLADGRRFAVAAGVGVDAAMIAETPHGLKRRLGVLAYILMGTRALLRFERFIAHIDVDGERREMEATAVLIANFGAVLRDLITLGDGISYDDGQLDVCVFAPAGVRDGIRIARRMLQRDFGPDPCIWYARGERIRIETVPPKPAEADGELLGTTPLSAEVEPRRGRVLLPGRPPTVRRWQSGAPHAKPGSDTPDRENRWKRA